MESSFRRLRCSRRRGADKGRARFSGASAISLSNATTVVSRRCNKLVSCVWSLLPHLLLAAICPLRLTSGVILSRTLLSPPPPPPPPIPQCQPQAELTNHNVIPHRCHDGLWPWTPQPRGYRLTWALPESQHISATQHMPSTCLEHATVPWHVGLMLLCEITCTIF